MCVPVHSGGDQRHQAAQLQGQRPCQQEGKLFRQEWHIAAGLNGRMAPQAVGVRPAGTKGVELVFKNTKSRLQLPIANYYISYASYASLIDAFSPKSSTYTVKLSKGARPTGKAIRGLTATSYYRPDMTKVSVLFTLGKVSYC